MSHAILLRCMLCACALGLGVAQANAAPPLVPQKLSYQGVLLDDQGLPRTGNIDLTLRIHDAPIGGTLLYVQTLSAVPLSDGVFSVALGPTGSSTDLPADPLTTSLAEALAGDLSGTAPARFLEVTVGLEGALGRTQVLTAPYALRAESAAQADLADTATSVTSVGGLPADVLTQIFENTNLDGSGPPNNDPSEGLGDPDGDGIQNFVDPDNDDDGLSDSAELAQGSDINLVTPVLFGVAPTSGFGALSRTVRVTGANFASGPSVVFGTQSPVPFNLSAGAFDIVVGPQPFGFADLQVTLPNGQTDTLTAAFNFVTFMVHSVVTDIHTNFSLDMFAEAVSLISGNGQYEVDGFNVAYPTANPGALPPGQLDVVFDPAGNVAGLRCRDLGAGTSCDVEIAIDSDGDGSLLDEPAQTIETLATGTAPRILSPRLAFDPSGHPVAGYFRFEIGTQAVVAHDRDGDGLFTGPNEHVVLDNTVGVVSNRSSLVVDAGGHVAFAYVDGSNNSVRLAWDRNGDGDFADTLDGNPEFSSIVPGAPSCLALAFASNGDLVVLYGTGIGLILGRDGNADGDFADPGETTALNFDAITDCDVSSDGSSLVVAHLVGTAGQLQIDRNDDGDFDDAAESSAFSTTAGAVHVAVAKDDSGHAFVATAGPGFFNPNRLFAAPNP